MTLLTPQRPQRKRKCPGAPRRKQRIIGSRRAKRLVFTARQRLLMARRERLVRRYRSLTASLTSLPSPAKKRRVTFKKRRVTFASQPLCHAKSSRVQREAFAKRVSRNSAMTRVVWEPVPVAQPDKENDLPGTAKPDDVQKPYDWTNGEWMSTGQYWRSYCCNCGALFDKDLPKGDVTKYTYCCECKNY